MNGSGKCVELTAEMREKLLDRHPVTLREYRFNTPMLERTYAIVRDRVWARRTGVFFYGPPRLGKSTCAEELQSLLSLEFTKAYVLLASVRGTSRPNESHMFRLLLEANNHELASRASPSLLFKNIKNDIKMKVALCNGSQFVLIIDEMQLLNDTDLQQLLVLHNALGLEKIRMTTISFAQPQILNKLTGLMTRHETQIIARFLSEPFMFEGCISAEELRTLLKRYDNDSEFPEKSGCSYTGFFFPEACRHGFKLGKYADGIWKALLKAAEPYNKCGIPMEHLCLTIEYLLLAHYRFDCATFGFSDLDIEEAVDSSNLKNFSACVQPEIH